MSKTFLSKMRKLFQLIMSITEIKLKILMENVTIIFIELEILDL